MESKPPVDCFGFNSFAMLTLAADLFAWLNAN